MKILLLNQCFYPDVVSTAQHLTDLALELVRAGHEVTIVTGDRGYDNSAKRFSRRETWKGIKIIRIRSLALGKTSRWRRALNFASFLIICALRLLLLPRFDVTVALTSPPLISFLGSLFTRIRGGKFFFWVMDLNPDEAIAAGWLKERSLSARFLGWCLVYSLRRAEKIIVLDRFMRQRLIDKGISEEKLSIIAPWSHSDSVHYDVGGRTLFREAHGLSSKYVVMYSGNHSPCHPLDTLLQSARQLAADSRIVFCFAGGGSEYEKVQAFAEQHQLKNIVCLPYQPLDKLSMSLSAADVHVVVMGDPFVGIVHPCKIYNVLQIGAPVIYIGPSDSHVVDILSMFDDVQSACIARHGDVDSVTSYLLTRARLTRPGRLKPATELSSKFARVVLAPQIVRLLEDDPATRLQSATMIQEANHSPANLILSSED